MSTDHGYLARQLGAALAAARTNGLELTQREAAAELGVANISLRELEVGTANPTLARVERVADGLGLEVTITVKPRKRGRK